MFRPQQIASHNSASFMDSDQFAEMMEELRNFTAALVDHAAALREHAAALRLEAGDGDESRFLD